MTENPFEINGIRIIVNKKLAPLQMKEKGYINGCGREIVQELEVSEKVYSKLKSKYGDGV